MSAPPSYKDFSKGSNDLLGKVFPKKAGSNTWGVEFDFKPSKCFSLNAKVFNNGTGEFKETVCFDDFGLTYEGTYKTEKPSLETSLAMDDKIPADGLSAKLHFDASNTSQTAGFSFKFEHDYVNLGARVFLPVTKALLDFVDDDAVKVQNSKFEGDFVATHPDYKVFAGAVAKLEFPTGADVKKNELGVAFGWHDSSFSADASYTQALDKDGNETKNCAFKVLAKPGETTYVAELGYNVVDQASALTLGLSYPLNDGATVKTRVSTKKEVGLAYSRQLSEGSKFDFGVLANLAGDDIETTFAFNLKFTQ